MGIIISDPAVDPGIRGLEGTPSTFAPSNSFSGISALQNTTPLTMNIVSFSEPQSPALNSMISNLTTPDPVQTIISMPMIQSYNDPLNVDLVSMALGIDQTGPSALSLTQNFNTQVSLANLPLDATTFDLSKMNSHSGLYGSSSLYTYMPPIEYDSRSLEEIMAADPRYHEPGFLEWVGGGIADGAVWVGNRFVAAGDSIATAASETGSLIYYMATESEVRAAFGEGLGEGWDRTIAKPVTIAANAVGDFASEAKDVAYYLATESEVRAAFLEGAGDGAENIKDFVVYTVQHPDRAATMVVVGVGNGVASTVGCIGDLGVLAINHVGTPIWNGGMSFVGLDGSVGNDGDWTAGKIDYSLTDDLTGVVEDSVRYVDNKFDQHINPFLTNNLGIRELSFDPEARNGYERAIKYTAQGVTEVGGFIVITAATAGTASAGWAVVRGGGAMTRVGRGLMIVDKAADGVQAARIMGGTYETTRGARWGAWAFEHGASPRLATALADGTNTAQSTFRFLAPVQRTYNTSNGVMTANQLTRAANAGENILVTSVRGWRINPTSLAIDTAGFGVSVGMNYYRDAKQANMALKSVAGTVQNSTAQVDAQIVEKTQKNISDIVPVIQMLENTIAQDPSFVLDAESKDMLRNIQQNFRTLLESGKIDGAPELKLQVEETLRHINHLVDGTPLSLHTDPASPDSHIRTYVVHDLSGAFAWVAEPEVVPAIHYDTTLHEAWDVQPARLAFLASADPQPLVAPPSLDQNTKDLGHNNLALKI